MGNAQQTQAFIDAWKKEFDETLSNADASIRLRELVALYECLLGLGGIEDHSNTANGLGDMGTS